VSLPDLRPAEARSRRRPLQGLRPDPLHSRRRRLKRPSGSSAAADYNPVRLPTLAPRPPRRQGAGAYSSVGGLSMNFRTLASAAALCLAAGAPPAMAHTSDTPAAPVAPAASAGFAASD